MTAIHRKRYLQGYLSFIDLQFILRTSLERSEMLLSTFELLLKPITPTPGAISGSDRGILQGYFLNLANPTASNLRIRLRFNTTTPTLDPSQLLSILDTNGDNDPNSSLVADGPNRFQYDLTLNAGDTGLFILQPNISTLDPATAQLEIRGFVEIFIVVSFFFGTPQPLLVTPEHRGTFLPSPGGNGEFDQLIVSLPTSTGTGLMEVDTITSPMIQPGSFFGVNSANIGGVTQPSLPQILNAMVERIAAIETRLNPDHS